MKQESKKINWKEIDDSMVKHWYFVSKIMHTLIPKNFPYFTFVGIIEEIKEDPNYKKKE